jgi:hypothetical protein
MHTGIKVRGFTQREQNFGDGEIKKSHSLPIVYRFELVLARDIEGVETVKSTSYTDLVKFSERWRVF